MDDMSAGANLCPPADTNYTHPRRRPSCTIFGLPRTGQVLADSDTAAFRLTLSSRKHERTINAEWR